MTFEEIQELVKTDEGVNGPVNGPVNGSVKSLSESLKQLYIVVFVSFFFLIWLDKTILLYLPTERGFKKTKRFVL